MSTVLDQSFELVAIDSLEPHPDNPRKGNVPLIAESIATNGFYGTVVAQRSTNRILAGKHRWEAAKGEGLKVIPCLWVDVDDEQAKKILVVDNSASDAAVWDDIKLAELLESVKNQTGGLEGTGFDQAAFDAILKQAGDALLPGAAVEPEPEHKTLIERFGVPPFSVLDARQGYWQERKRAWLALGIQSELGRGGGTWRESQTGSPIDRKRAYGEG